MKRADGRGTYLFFVDFFSTPKFCPLIAKRKFMYKSLEKKFEDVLA